MYTLIMFEPILFFSPVRFQVADALKMNPDCDTFKEVLKHFESDDNWDPNHPMEAIWIKLKEKRYRLEDLKGFTKTADKEEDKEVMVKDTQGGAQSSNLLMLGSSEPQIKLENEKWSKLQARLKVAKSGKGILAAHICFYYAHDKGLLGYHAISQESSTSWRMNSRTCWPS
jgi:hypothetical protein